MAKTKQWQPGDLVETQEDFERALEFFAQEGGANGEAGAQTQGVAEIALGEWLAQRARALNEALTQNKPLGGKERVELVQEAKNLLLDLAEIREAIAKESFEPFARKSIGFNLQEAKFLVSEIDGLRDFSNRLAEVLGGEEDPSAAIARLRESPEWRRALKGSPGRMADTNSYYAALLDCVAQEANPALKAELTAKMELYIESGWAAADILGAEGSQTKAAAGIRKLCERMRTGEGRPGGSLKAIGERFSEVFLPIRVRKSEGLDGEEDSFGEIAKGGKGKGLRAGVGMLDAAIRDARDPSIIHAAIVTTDESTWIENTQIFRHQRALQAAIADGGIPGAKDARISFYVPSLFYDRGAAKGREIGEQFLSAMRDPLENEERQALNTLPFLSAIGRIDRSHPHYSVDALAACDLRMIGAKADLWNASARRVRAIEDSKARKEAFLMAVGEEVAKASDVFRKKFLDGSKLKTANSNRALLGAFCESLEGLLHHAVECPQALAPIESRVADLRVFRAQISGDSEMRRRLESAILIFSREGGFRAWAREALASEALDRDLEEQARKSRVAEIEAFVERLAREGSLSSNDFRALKTGWREGGEIAGWFTKEERARIEKSNDPKQISDLIRERASAALRDEAEKGSIERLASLLGKGARVAGLDASGRDAAEIARAGGNRDGSLFLSLARDKQVLEEEVALLRAEREAPLAQKQKRATKGEKR